MPDEASRRSATGEEPRTDLPPKKLPYDDDYFGSGEEEGAVKEREASEQGGERAPAESAAPEPSGRPRPPGGGAK